jgi:hypothetical protein
LYDSHALYDSQKIYSSSSESGGAFSHYEENFKKKCEEIIKRYNPGFEGLGGSLFGYLEAANNEPELCDKLLINFHYKYESEVSAYVNRELAKAEMRHFIDLNKEISNYSDTPPSSGHLNEIT